MKIIIQRVLSANVRIDNEIIGAIRKGLCVFLGVEETDTPEIAEKMLKKVISLRIFEDDAGKMNKSLLDTGAALLIVSQFTLLADCFSGRRPSFSKAGSPVHAEKLYEIFVQSAKRENIFVQTGRFGADMLVGIENDGPATFILESEKLK